MSTVITQSEKGLGIAHMTCQTNNIPQSVILSETPSAQMTSDFTESTEIVYARRFVVVANVRSSCAPVLETHTRL